MKTLKRKTRSDKYPLTRHQTGQYCKKIKGKMYYFGSDKKQALQRYLEHAAHLYGNQGNSTKPINENMTLKQLCDMYLKYQFSKVQANSLTARHHNDQVASLNKLMSILGRSREIKDISIWRRGQDSNPRNTNVFICFRGRCYRPLSHLYFSKL